MASKGAVIAGHVFIWITVALVIIIMGMTCYACSCNIRASTFDNVEQREGLINMYGCVFWGYPLAFVSVVAGASLIGLLVLADKHLKKTGATNNTAPSE